MRIVVYSNFINHHQIPLAKAFNCIPNVEYIFVATTPFDIQRQAMGYKDENKLYDFILRAYDGDKENKIAHQLAKDADVVMMGSAPDEYMTERLRGNKITFRTTERYFRNGFKLQFYPRYFASAIKHLRPYQKLPLYFLCMSAYTPYDINLFTSFKNRSFKWAYFTENRMIDYTALKRNKKTTILWTGRFLSLKHPDAAIRVAVQLKKENYSFQMNFIGGGEMRETLDALIQQNNLADCVNLLGFMPQDKVRNHMEESDIFLFTSDYKEGWGAVLNEAMSSGCAVVASHACGSTPFLVKDKTNGLIYESGNEQDLLQKTKMLLDDIGFRNTISRNAFQDMRRFWDARVAAQRFLLLFDAIKEGNQTSIFQDGPCSPAQIIKDNWYRA